VLTSGKNMQADYRKGLKIGLLIYGIGILVTVALHLVLGWDNAHAPPTSALPLAVTLVVGAFRFVYCVFEIIAKRSTLAKGELAIHLSIAAALLIFVMWMNYRYG
jgi:hypothetical protein